MRRRDFLLTSGAALLGSTTVISSRQPVIALDFDLSADLNADPSTVDSVMIDFTKFELIPRYIEDKSGTATITITLDVADQDPVQYSTEQQLTNSQKVTRGDISSIIPLVIDNISTTAGINGDVKIDVEHPSISDSYQQSFFVSGSDIPDGGVARWMFEDNTDTSVAVDSWGDNDGTINGATYTTTAYNGTYALSFDGDNDYISLGDKSVFKPDQFTISMWVRLSDEPSNLANNQAFFAKRDGLNNAGYAFVLQTDGDYFCSIGNGSSEDFNNAPGTGSEYIWKDTWHHVVASYDGSSMRTYVDANEEHNSETNSVSHSSNDARIGDYTESDTNLDAVVDDPRFYDRSLSASKISNLYQTGSI